MKWLDSDRLVEEAALHQGRFGAWLWATAWMA
jgi:hypothetical protein